MLACRSTRVRTAPSEPRSTYSRSTSRSSGMFLTVYGRWRRRSNNRAGRISDLTSLCRSAGWKDGSMLRSEGDDAQRRQSELRRELLAVDLIGFGVDAAEVSQITAA